MLILHKKFGYFENFRKEWYVLCFHSVEGGKKRWKEKKGNMRNYVIKKKNAKDWLIAFTDMHTFDMEIIINNNILIMHVFSVVLVQKMQKW